jgi:tRNA G18 (ribose-2'-O)-methylase SpoU
LASNAFNSGNVIRLNDADDPRLVYFRDVRHHDFPGDGRFIAEGRLVVQRLIESRYRIESILVEDGKQADYVTGLSSKTPIYCLPRAAIEQLVGFDFHRGVMACAVREPFADVAEFTFDASAQPLVLAILGVDDQENMGSLLRSAAALGVNRILLGPCTTDPFKRRVIRVSMASALVHRFFRLPNPLVDLKMLSEQFGLRIVAGTLDDSTSLHDFKRDDRSVVLMVGNESRGIDPLIQQIADDRVRIPMRQGTDSLNVAVAAAIMMYELTGPKSAAPR